MYITYINTINKSLKTESRRAEVGCSPGLDCRTLVSPNSTTFLCAPSTSRHATAPHSSTDPFRRGVDSTGSMTTLAIHLPRTSSKSAGMVVSVF